MSNEGHGPGEGRGCFFTLQEAGGPGANSVGVLETASLVQRLLFMDGQSQPEGLGDGGETRVPGFLCAFSSACLEKRVDGSCSGMSGLVREADILQVSPGCPDLHLCPFSFNSENFIYMAGLPQGAVHQRSTW